MSCSFVTYSNTNGIALEAQWIPRSLNGKADLLRRFIDENDSPVNPYVFRVVEAKWGPRTNLNRFTSYYRAFSFRVLTPSLLLLVVGVSDAFVRDWSGKDNWIFFPVCLVVVAWFEPDLALYARFGTFVRHVSWLILRWGIQFQAWLVCSWMLTFHPQSWRYGSGLLWWREWALSKTGVSAIRKTFACLIVSI